MSWLWGNETTEQAQIVVSALQGELDERELKIQALEAALRREQQDFQQLLQSEIRELEAKRSRIAHELEEVDVLIAGKQKLLQKGKGGGSGSTAGTAPAKSAAAASASTAAPAATAKPKKKKASTASTNGTTAATAAPSAVTAAVAAAATGAPAPLEKKASEKKKTKAKKPKAAEPPALPLGEQLLKVASVEPNVVFIIQRSTNANTVVYSGQLQGRALDPTKPLEVFWLMYEKPGAPREDLNMIERNTAYGVVCTPHATAPGQFNVVLSSLKDRECVLLVHGGRVQARTTIGGQHGMVLCRVFVQMTTGWVPSVEYIELFGFDPATLAPVYEKKSNK